MAIQPEITPLCLFLRETTGEEHTKTENSSIMLALMCEQFSLVNYQRLLKRMLLFYLPVENKIKAFLEVNPLSYSYYPKHPLLAADLLYVSGKAAKVKTEESITPTLESLEDFLGILYVLEGSTLGGALIHKTLEKHIDVAKAARFFYPYGKETRKHWDETCRYINRWGEESTTDRNRVGNTAIAAFQSIRRVLNDESIT